MAVVEKQGAVSVVRPQGPLVEAQCASFLDAALNKLGQGRPMVVIDLHEVPLIDSAGLETLVEVRERIESRGGAVKLAAVNALCSDILRVTGVGQKFEQYPHIKSAVARFAE
jgi:anti-anti-sigma factor